MSMFLFVSRRQVTRSVRWFRRGWWGWSSCSRINSQWLKLQKKPKTPTTCRPWSLTPLRYFHHIHLRVVPGILSLGYIKIPDVYSPAEGHHKVTWATSPNGKPIMHCRNTASILKAPVVSQSDSHSCRSQVCGLRQIWDQSDLKVQSLSRSVAYWVFLIAPGRELDCEVVLA